VHLCDLQRIHRADDIVGEPRHRVCAHRRRAAAVTAQIDAQDAIA